MNTQPNKTIVFSPILIRKEKDYENFTEFLKGVKIEIDNKIFSEFSIFDDGNEKKWKEKLNKLKRDNKQWLKIVENDKNIGVAKTLLKAYKQFSETAGENGIIVRLDSDREHDPKKIAELVKKINTGFDGAICQIEYKNEHLKELDKIFNDSQGFLQGKIIFNEELKHNCPGFTAYKVKVLKKIISAYEAYIGIYEGLYGDCKWGGDIVIMFLANLSGFTINRETTQESTGPAPNRTPTKIAEQLLRNTQHISLMIKLKSITDLKLNK